MSVADFPEVVQALVNELLHVISGAAVGCQQAKDGEGCGVAFGWQGITSFLYQKDIYHLVILYGYFQNCKAIFRMCFSSVL